MLDMRAFPPVATQQWQARGFIPRLPTRRITRRGYVAAAQLIAAGKIVVKRGVGAPLIRGCSPPSMSYCPIGSGDRRKIALSVSPDSPAWRSQSINAMRIMDRLLVENLNHMRARNGKLRVSSRNSLVMALDRALSHQRYKT
jgi:hypothetical protein